MILPGIFIFLLNILLVSYTIRKTIYIANKKMLFDDPTEDRKTHPAKTPNLGGVAIFSSLAFTSTLLISGKEVIALNHLIPACLIIFFLGFMDDLVGVNPSKKFLGQICAALLTTAFTGYRLTSLGGLFGLQEMSSLPGLIISSLFLILVINAFNLIDGINGLAGMLGLIAAGFFTCSFYMSHSIPYMLGAAGLGGCIVGFLYFNQTPARIFMGDTGAMFIGYLLGLFSLHYINLAGNRSVPGLLPTLRMAPVLISALLMVPLFDTIRVFTVRVYRKRPPFSADRNHIHHRLIDLGLSHLQTTTILSLVTLSCLGLTYLSRNLNNNVNFLILAVYALSLDGFVSVCSRRKLEKTLVSGKEHSRTVFEERSVESSRLKVKLQLENAG